MNVLLAANLFDSPWTFAIVLVVGALFNWLAKRFQDRQADPPPSGDETPPAAGRPSREFDLEEALRRLMGEEPRAPAPRPPAIPGLAEGGMPSVQDGPEEEEPWSAARRTLQVPCPPPLAVAVASAAVIPAADEELDEETRRFLQLSEPGHHPATVQGHLGGHRSGGGRRTTSRWRAPRRAREAWVASIVFGPPKSLEP